MPTYLDNLQVKLTAPFTSGALSIVSLSGTEQVSRPFEYELVLWSERHDLDPDRVLGQPMAVEFLDEQDRPKRYIHGRVSELAYLDWKGPGSHYYRAKLRPWLWFLSHKADCRIFQNKNVTAIVSEVCRQAGFTDIKLQVGESYESREYCVQYRESDFAFVSRLLEQEGIFYYFQHSRDKHTLVLVDDVARLPSMQGYERVPFYPESDNYVIRDREHLRTWKYEKSFHAGKFATADYDFEKPTSKLAAVSTVSRAYEAGKYEVFDYPSQSTRLTTAGVERIAKVRVQELQSSQMVARGVGDAVGLVPGYVFELRDHPRPEYNKKYVVTRTSMKLEYGRSDSSGFDREKPDIEVSIEAADASEPYRPARVTPKPVIHGTQTAVVVGPKEQEIFTDKYGRVKVQFHWDRYGKKDAESSCWVRIAQPLAGKNWGAIHIPRIGQEVVVSFLEGDPDRPLIVGSVYNGDQMPPYALPANMTQSGFKSRSTKDGTSETFNEIRFEDKKGSEEIYIHAEKNMNVVIENDQTVKIGLDKKDKGDRTVQIHNDDTLKVGHDRTVEIGNDDRLKVRNNLTADVDKALTTKVGDKESREVGKGRNTKIGDDDLLDVGRKLTLKAGDQITLEVGMSKIVMKNDGTIEISGKTLKLSGTMKAEMSAAQTKVAGTQLDLEGTKTAVKGSGVLDLQGGGVASLRGGVTKIG